MVKDQYDGSHENTTANNLLEDRFSAGEDYAQKARKPYTITKQREKWTQEEHIRFLEALKLYGRSWRHIQEHMGNRTAVQIRSHAQKFFSKVIRESSNGTEGGPIKIPPPRAKRKPTRPYPRKVSVPLKKAATYNHGSPSPCHENMSHECGLTQSLKLFGKTVFITGSKSPNFVDTLTKLPWNSMPTLVPECLAVCSLSGRIEPTIQFGSQDSENGEYGDKGERFGKGFTSSVLTYEEREELRVRLCL